MSASPTLKTHGFEILVNQDGTHRFNAKIKKGGLSAWARMADIATMIVVDSTSVIVNLRTGTGFHLEVDAVAFDQAYRTWLHGGPVEEGGAA